MQTLRKGSRGQDVRVLQRCLALYADGIFGPLTEEAVKELQENKGLTPDGIVGPLTWAALGVAAKGRKIDEIILHCTATPEGEEFSNSQIKAAHLARGFSDIGYHFIIGLNGEVRRGRPVAIAGAHCKGHNTRSIGISYVGGCPPRTTQGWKNKSKDTRTPAQKKAIRELVEALKKEYPGATVHCHYEFANKACPSFKLCDL